MQPELFPIVKSFEVIFWEFTIVHIDVFPRLITLLRVFLELWSDGVVGVLSVTDASVPYSK